VSAAEGGFPRRVQRTLEMLLVLSRSDLRSRYGRSGMKSLKWLLEPLAALGVYLALITFLVPRTSAAPGLSLACAIVPFQFVVTGSINAFRSITLCGSVIANMAFPRWLIPASSVATETITSSASLTILPLMMIVYGIAPTAAILWLPIALAVTVIFSLSLAYPFALIGIWYPELQAFVGSIVRTAFFLAPGLIALDQVTGTAHTLLPLNPLSGLFESFRAAVLYGHSPAAWELLGPLGAAGLLFAIFLPVYRREQPYLAKLVGE
jgi:homopolymeric O-antigen transport system permease protein